MSGNDEVTKSNLCALYMSAKNVHHMIKIFGTLRLKETIQILNNTLNDLIRMHIFGIYFFHWRTLEIRNWLLKQNISLISDVAKFLPEMRNIEGKLCEIKRFENERLEKIRSVEIVAIAFKRVPSEYITHDLSAKLPEINRKTRFITLSREINNDNEYVGPIKDIIYSCCDIHSFNNLESTKELEIMFGIPEGSEVTLDIGNY